MSIDRSLRSGGGLAKHRNVLTRAERIAKLAEKDRFDMSGDTPTGLPKVANRKVSTGVKATKKAEAAAEGETAETLTDATDANKS